MKIILMIWATFFVLCSFSQTDKEVFLFDKNTNPGAILREIPLAEPRLEGSAYLYDHWKIADFTLKNGKVLHKIYFQYDMLNEIFELKGEGFAKKIKSSFFTKIKVYNDELNFSDFSNYDVLDDYDPEQGMIKILFSDDSITIAEKPYIEIKQPTYVPTHHVGNRNMVISKKLDYYIIKDGTFIRFKRTKTSLSELSDKSSKQVKTFIKSQALDLKNDEHLVEVIKYLFKK